MDIQIFKTPLSRENINVLSDESGETYPIILETFISKFSYPKKQYLNLSNRALKFNDDNITLTIPEKYDDVFDYNYVEVIQNNREFYYFVERVESQNFSSTPATTLYCSMDYWGTFYDQIIHGDYDRSQEVVRKSQRQTTRIGTTNLYALNPYYFGRAEKGIGSSTRSYATVLDVPYDILWLKLTLDPGKDYTLTYGDITDTVYQYCSEYGTMKYAFIPFKIFFKGTPNVPTDAIQYGVGDANRFAAIITKMQTNPLDFNFDTAYVYDVSFTFYAPIHFTGEVSGNQYFKYINYDRSYCNCGTLKTGDTVIATNCITCTAKESKNTEYQKMITTMVIDPFENTLKKFDAVNNTYSTLTLSPAVGAGTSFIGAPLTNKQIADINEDSYKYPNRFLSIKCGMNEIPIDFGYNYGKLALTIYPKASGARLGIEMKDYFNDTDFSRSLTTLIDNLTIEQGSSIPFTYDQYSLFWESNSARQNVQMANSITNGILSILGAKTQIGEGVAKVALGVVSKSPSAVLGGASDVQGGKLGLVKGISDVGFTIANRFALNHDLHNMVNSTQNLPSNAINDTWFSDRVFIFYNEQDFNDERNCLPVIDTYENGSCVNYIASDFLSQELPLYNYIQTVECRIPTIVKQSARDYIERLFNRGVRIWNVDNMPGNTVDELSPVYNFKTHVLNVSATR